MKTIKIQILLAFLVLLTMGCDNTDDPTGEGNADTDTDTDSDTDTDPQPWDELLNAAPNLPQVDGFNDAGTDISSAVNRFGLELFNELDAPDDGNIFISPMSISTVLGMAWNGSVDTVEQEMRDTLGYGTLDAQTIREGYQNLVGGLLGQDEETILELANALWYRSDLTLGTAFVTESTDYFGCHVNQLHMDPLVATEQVNNWVDTNTHGLIPTIVPEDQPFSADTAVVLVNTIYFKGEWQTEFDSNLTADADFTTADGAVQVPMMQRPDAYLPYFENDDLQMVRLGYKVDGFAMTAVVPKSGIILDDVIATLDADVWQQWQGDMQAQEGTIRFPKFSMDFDTLLNDPLKSMGMPLAFAMGSGFDKMVPDHGLAISRVLHKTSLEINEKGTEAAGATMVEYVDSASMDPFSISFNTPFLLFIHDTETNTILFMGRVENPTL